MTRRRGCATSCCSTCTICTDSGGDGPCGLVEVAGTVTSDADFIYITASDSIALATPTSGTETGVVASANFIAANSGDEARVFVKSDEFGETNYFAQITVHASAATLKIYKRVALVDTLLGSVPITAPVNETLNLTVCAADSSVRADESVYGGFLVVAADTDADDVPYAGVSTGDITAEVDFSNFSFGYKYSDTKTTCPHCFVGCGLVLDPFDRADNLDIDADSPYGWSAVSGSWEVYNQELVCSATGVAISTTPITTGQAAMRVSAKVRGAANGDEAWVIAKYKDASNYWYAKLTFGTGATLKIFERTGGTSTQRQTASVTAALDTTYTLSICYGEGQVSANIHEGGTVLEYTTPTTATDAQYGGVGATSTSDSLFFDNFTVGDGLSDAFQLCPSCDPCATDTGCCTETLADITDVDITLPSDWIADNLVSGCNAYNGATYTLTTAHDEPTCTDFTACNSVQCGGPTAPTYYWTYVQNGVKSGSCCASSDPKTGTLDLTICLSVCCESQACVWRLVVAFVPTACTGAGCGFYAQWFGRLLGQRCSEAFELPPSAWLHSQCDTDDEQLCRVADTYGTVTIRAH